MMPRKELSHRHLEKRVEISTKGKEKKETGRRRNRKRCEGRRRREIDRDAEGRKGRMYYRIGLRYIPKDLGLKAADFGFTITRHFESVDNAQDVWREKKPDGEAGAWHVKLGSRVRVILGMVIKDARYHIALVDRFGGRIGNHRSKTLGTNGKCSNSTQQCSSSIVGRTLDCSQKSSDETSGSICLLCDHWTLWLQLFHSVNQQKESHRSSCFKFTKCMYFMY